MCRRAVAKERGRGESGRRGRPRRGRGEAAGTGRSPVTARSAALRGRSPRRAGTGGVDLWGMGRYNGDVTKREWFCEKVSALGLASGAV